MKECIVGTVSKEIVTEYVADETGELKISKQKVNEKTIPPNVDLLKLIYSNLTVEKTDYNSLTDDELEKEKLRLIKLLKEEESASRKNNGKDKV